MSVSCSCGDSDYDFMYYGPKDFTPLSTKRRRRCISCRELIDIGSDAGIFTCWRAPHSAYEEVRFGDEVPLANKWMCEECTGLYMALQERGFCITICDGMTMRDNVRSLTGEFG